MTKEKALTATVELCKGSELNSLSFKKKAFLKKYPSTAIVELCKGSELNSLICSETSVLTQFSVLA